jgi:hypothetical protein
LSAISNTIKLPEMPTGINLAVSLIDDYTVFAALILNSRY